MMNVSKNLKRIASEILLTMKDIDGAVNRSFDADNQSLTEEILNDISNFKSELARLLAEFNKENAFLNNSVFTYVDLKYACTKVLENTGGNR